MASTMSTFGWFSQCSRCAQVSGSGRHDLPG
jgi:hypothetical protein